MACRMIELPYPPSLSHYYRHVGARVVISAEGRAYKRTVAILARLPGEPAIKGRLRVTIECRPPDRRYRDLDNLMKPLLDALRDARVYEDDSLIDDLRILRMPPFPGGSIIVHVEELADGPVVNKGALA